MAGSCWGARTSPCPLLLFHFPVDLWFVLGRPEHCKPLIQVKTNTHVILFLPNSVWCRHHVVSKGLDSLCSTKSPHIGGEGQAILPSGVA